MTKLTNIYADGDNDDEPSWSRSLELISSNPFAQYPQMIEAFANFLEKDAPDDVSSFELLLQVRRLTTLPTLKQEAAAVQIAEELLVSGQRSPRLPLDQMLVSPHSATHIPTASPPHLPTANPPIARLPMCPPTRLACLRQPIHLATSFTSNPHKYAPPYLRQPKTLHRPTHNLHNPAQLISATSETSHHVPSTHFPNTHFVAPLLTTTPQTLYLPTFNLPNTKLITLSLPLQTSAHLIASSCRVSTTHVLSSPPHLSTSVHHPSSPQHPTTYPPHPTTASLLFAQNEEVTSPEECAALPLRLQQLASACISDMAENQLTRFVISPEGHQAFMSKGIRLGYDVSYVAAQRLLWEGYTVTEDGESPRMKN